MKKLLTTIVLGALLLPSAAFASSLTLSPTTVAITEGQSFTVTVGVNPTSGKAYTVRANLSFDPSSLALTGFTFAPKWIPLSQSGYDTEDNVKGVMVKTGGYPGGVTAVMTFGTATFKAKKTGVATITGTADSLILDANNKNAVAGSQGSIQVFVAAAANVTPSVVKVSAPVVKNTPAKSATTTATSTEVTPQTASALSPLDKVLTLGTGSASVASLVTIVILLIFGGGIWLGRRSRPRG